MIKKFEEVPVEENTIITFQSEVKFGKYDVLYQKWFWDGINAESIIFANNDIDGLTDDDVKKEVKASPLLKEGSSVTLKRSETGFTFVNFNFEAE